MSEKLELMFEKVEQVLALLDRTKAENASLIDENKLLKAELVKIRKEYNSLRLDVTDQKDKVKSKLVGILHRLDQLEDIAS
jgi:regulator of replication initiation timing